MGARAGEGGRDDGRPAEDLNDAFGNLAGFAVDGAELLRVLDEQEGAVKQLVKNTGAVFGAINERAGALRDLIVNADNTFEATASRDRGARRDDPDLPDVPRRVEGDVARLEQLLAPTRGRWSTT